MSEPVAILGCGPAGLFAAQAVELAGKLPVIISKKQKSEIYGAQYLHRAIPGLSDPKPDGVVTTFLLGQQTRYAHRVYDDASRGTSWEKAGKGPVGVWDLRATYDRAWDKFENRIIDMTLDALSIGEHAKDFETVISTVPLWAICELPNHHSFQSVPILVKKEMEYTGLPFYITDNEGVVVYNGTEYGYWYRTSSIFGHGSTEARCSQSVLDDYHKDQWDGGFKVVSTDCDCHSSILKVGRMGKWQSGVLTHHAFQEVLELLTEDRIVAR